MSELTNREQKLVALGAAIASNCIPCIENSVPEARKAGFSDSQIVEAVQIADRVRQVPARMVLQTALARIEESPHRVALDPKPGCGCTNPDQIEESSCAD